MTDQTNSTFPHLTSDAAASFEAFASPEATAGYEWPTSLDESDAPERNRWLTAGNLLKAGRGVLAISAVADLRRGHRVDAFLKGSLAAIGGVVLPSARIGDRLMDEVMAGTGRIEKVRLNDEKLL